MWSLMSGTFMYVSDSASEKAGFVRQLSAGKRKRAEREVFLPYKRVPLARTCPNTTELME